MKTIVCVQPNQFTLSESQVPAVRAGEALVRIRRIGICGTDYHAYRGNQPFFTYPRILGHELSGVIETVPSGAHGLRPGDPVTIIPYLECGQCVACKHGKTNCCTDLKVLGVHTDGGMQEWISVPVDHLIKADGLTLDQAAVIEPLSIGAHGVRRSGVQAGEFALVIGVGPIGLGVMAFAKERGATVIAMDVNEARLEFCRNWAGIEYTVNALDHPLETLSRITGGELATVVYDATGNQRSMMDSFQYVANGGKLVFVGLVKTDITFSDPEFHRKEITLLASRNATPEDFQHVMSVVKAGGVNVGGYITHRADFDDMIGRFEQWLSPSSNVIKAMVELPE